VESSYFGGSPGLQSGRTAFQGGASKAQDLNQPLKCRQYISLRPIEGECSAPKWHSRHIDSRLRLRQSALSLLKW
jgi:hypothetical protein